MPAVANILSVENDFELSITMLNFSKHQDGAWVGLGPLGPWSHSTRVCPGPGLIHLVPLGLRFGANWYHIWRQKLVLTGPPWLAAAQVHTLSARSRSLDEAFGNLVDQCWSKVQLFNTLTRKHKAKT